MRRSKDGHASSTNEKLKASKKRELLRNLKRKTARMAARTVEQLITSTGLPFAELLAVTTICEVLAELKCEFRDRLYPPWVTMWGFLSQVTSKDGTCKATVTRINAYRTVTGQASGSPNGASYSDARSRLPVEFFFALARRIGQGLDAEGLPKWLWNGRHVKIVDGSTVTMPDTKANQKAFPQSSNQKTGVGFPVARITVLFSLSVGTILDAAITSTKGKKTGEVTAFRQLWRSLNPGDIVLGDCLYDGYGDIAQLKGRQVDVVFGMSQSRSRDFRRGVRLGDGDHIVEWTRPKYDKARFDRETWEALPQTMQMREVTTTIKDADGTRHTITLVTTLLDSESYPKESILSLFQQRWNCELDLRCVKTAMKMDHLTCKSPEMVCKEIWTYILAYNLIRCHMARAAYVHDVPPRKLSFSNARHCLDTFTLAVLGLPPDVAERLYATILKDIASQQVGNRPGRVEPRKLKRRKSKYTYMTEPRPGPQSTAT